MKYFLIVSLCICCSSYGMKKRLLSTYENLEREIFITKFYKDYSFELLQQIKSVDTHPINQKVFDTLFARGMQKYAALALQNTDLEPFEKYSLSELESLAVN